MRVVTTLHGTDVLTLGIDPAFYGVLQYSVLQSDAVTVPSRYLKKMAEQNFKWPASAKPMHRENRELKASGDI